MGVCFSSGPTQNSSSLDRPYYSGSASTNCKNVGITETTSSSTVNRQFSVIVSGSFYRRPISLPPPPPDGLIPKWPNLKVFDFEELKSATNNFRHDTLLGQGGFGRVYKGWLDEDTLAPTKAGSGMVVAIKWLNPESTQGFGEWQTELNMRRLSHPNLVNLLGYCWDDDELLLVYEFMPKGSLDNYLFKRNRNLELLSWNTRLKIAIGAARGLAFLHASENNVIHRDFKSSNILLDGNYNPKISDFGLATLGPSEGQSHNYNPKISDFGLAKLGSSEGQSHNYNPKTSDFGLAKLGTSEGQSHNYNPKISDLGLEKLGPSEGQSHVTTRVMGTYGYTAPEYMAEGHLYVKSDVYGFGVVLLEILTGMRAFDPKRPTGQHNLVLWTKPLLSSKKKLKKIMDTKIEGQYSLEAAWQAAQLTLKCLKSVPEERPSMKDVVEALEAIEAIQNPQFAVYISTTPSAGS
ncbi:probable serine/threonine-protein kinase PIX13 isoform X6 [Glycine soja]|uniref:probable serine/threonine-protein kinase PIX13 isoform X6 n=1 Tax=Glycine soja TaxID=3848 RepID=UPI00103ABD91|nr:probable serine/threonine-protein kinase PIX13 isoform X6 [Glycine soja]